MLRIGLTGGIGAGKSAACRIFAELGIPVIDADAISREVVAPGEPALATITQLFGPSLLTSDGTLDRSRLRAMIFAEPDLRQRLEAILHPLIRQRMLARVATMHAPYVILAIPLLLEAGWQELVDRVLVIDSPVEQQINRTISRDGISRQQAEAIVAAQMERCERLRQADDIVLNDGDLDHLHRQIATLHQRYLSMVPPGSI
jgi:dephospho-CoA kinase